MHCFSDTSMGLCFSKIIDGFCKGAAGRMEKVSKRDCCCSGGGVAFGTDCTACPDLNSGL